MHLGRAVIDAERADLPEQPRDDRVVGDAEPSQDLHAAVNNPPDRLRADDLGHAELVRPALAAVEHPGRMRGRPLPEWAGEFDCASWAQLFLKYILAEPAVTCVIPATGSPQHIKDNLAAGFGRLPDAHQRRQIRALWDAA